MARRTKFVSHLKHSNIVDIPDATQILASDWNSDHNLAEGWNDVTGTTYTVDALDHLSVVRFTGGAACAVSIGAMAAGFYAIYKNNIVNADVTFTGTGGATIDGQPTFVLKPSQSVVLHCLSGTTFETTRPFIKASIGEATAGTDDSKYMTP